MARLPNRDRGPNPRTGPAAIYPVESPLDQPVSGPAADAVVRASTYPESVISTVELGRRSTRSPDHASENRALVALVEAMTAASPDLILQTLVETARELCRAH